MGKMRKPKAQQERGAPLRGLSRARREETGVWSRRRKDYFFAFSPVKSKYFLF